VCERERERERELVCCLCCVCVCVCVVCVVRVCVVCVRSGTLGDADKVLVDIGTGYYVEKTPEEADDYLKRKVMPHAVPLSISPPSLYLALPPSASLPFLHSMSLSIVLN
jgi:hypothetical protein